MYVRKPLANMYSPLKRKYIRGNNSPFINRIISKETIKRTRLRNKFFKSKSEVVRKTTSNKEVTVCLCLGERKRSSHYGNLDPKKIADKRTFSRTVKPFQ